MYKLVIMMTSLSSELMGSSHAYIYDIEFEDEILCKKAQEEILTQGNIPSSSSVTAFCFKVKN